MDADKSQMFTLFSLTAASHSTEWAIPTGSHKEGEMRRLRFVSLL